MKVMYTVQYYIELTSCYLGTWRDITLLRVALIDTTILELAGLAAKEDVAYKNHGMEET